MRKIFLSVLISQFLILSCSTKKPNFETDELIGVWSGLLFQTESKYDSIAISTTNQSTEAVLYKSGEKTTYPILQEGNNLSFKGSSGLRFDATLNDNNQTLNATLTNDLWVQSLNFEKLNNKWVSKIHKPEIIDTDYLVYLEFYEDSSGNMEAKIQSNKENRKLHFTIEEVLFDGNEIDFKISNDRFGISAKYEVASKSLLLKYGNAGGKREIQLTKLLEGELEGYMGKSVNEKYEYKTPEPIDDLILAASLEDVGLNRSLLGFMEQINNEKYEHIHSIIITKNQKLVFEEYFHGYDREYLHDIRSAFKSIASLTVGKAMMKNSDLKVGNTILDYYPKYEITDIQKRNITVHQALTMSTGITLEDEDIMQWENYDWVGYKLNLPMKYQPGEKFEYSSGGCNLLSGVIEESVGKYLPLFIYEEMLLPMGIRKFQMLTSPQWRGYLAGSFYLRPIDFTKFGLLMLNKGKWNGKELINTSWIEESTSPQINGDYPADSDYGYLWRLLERDIKGKKMKTIEAWGNGGQFLIIIPEIDMTVSFTSGNYNLFPQMEDGPFEILNEYILPSIMMEKN